MWSTVSSNEDKLKQINGVQDLVARGVKGILISPIDATGVNAAYDAAAAGKVPIVSVARGSTSPNQTLACRDGREADRPRHRRMDRARRSAARARSPCCSDRRARRRSAISREGYNEVMAKYPGIQIVFKTDGPLTRERGLKNAEDALVANPDLAAIYTANDDVALGRHAGGACRQPQGQDAGHRHERRAAGACARLKDGNLGMTIELNPVLWGRLGVDVLAEYLKGGKVEPRVFIKHVIIDKAISTRSCRRA